MSKCKLCLLLILFWSCGKDDEMPPLIAEPLTAECEGSNMFGSWSVIDSVEMIFLDVDSIDHQVYHTELTLYENNVGNLDIPSFNRDFFIRWSLQCDPDIFTISQTSNTEDSIFLPMELYTVLPFEILVNGLDYKKMRREEVGSINQFNQRRITVRDLIRN